MKRSYNLNEEIENIKLGTIMDEAVAATPSVAYYRVRAMIEGHKTFTYGLVICAAKGTLIFDELARFNSTQRTVPACQMRMRTIGEALRQTAERMHDIGCQTTDPDLYLFATINPYTIDHLEIIMTDLPQEL